MANCKLCGKPVAAARVWHPACWEREAEKMAEVFCDQYCRWPQACRDEEELEEHCDSLPDGGTAEPGIVRRVDHVDQYPACF